MSLSQITRLFGFRANGMRADDDGGWEWFGKSAPMCFVCVFRLYNHDAKIPIMNLSFDIVNIIRSRHPINSLRCLQCIGCKHNASQTKPNQTKHNRLGFCGPMNPNIEVLPLFRHERRKDSHSEKLGTNQTVTFWIETVHPKVFLLQRKVKQIFGL